MRRASILCLASLLFANAQSAFADPPTIASLGAFSSPYPASVASAISGDGKVVVGWSSVGTQGHAVRWSAAGGMQDLGTLSGAANSSSDARGLSSDGSVVVGQSYDDNGGSSSGRAFRWAQGSGMTSLGLLPSDTSSAAYSASGDGATIVGESRSGNSVRAFLWTSGGMTELLPGVRSVARAIAFDGLTIVGDPDGGYGFRLSSSGTTELIPPGGFGAAYVWGLSRTGAFAAGSYNLGSSHAAVWNELGQCMPLEDLEGTSAANDVSANGRVVVGGIGSDACVWIDGTPNSLKQLLRARGVDVSLWDRLYFAASCSDDGRHVCGYGQTAAGTRAFYALLPNNGPTVIAPQATSVECTGGLNLVNLLAIVDDVEGDALTVEWRVNNVLEKTDAVAAGGSSSFEFDYPHGTNAVSVRVYDADHETTSGTTVTVDDTTAPVVVVAPNVDLNVDQGELFASSSRLTPPEVTDACDGDPLLSHDAPAQLPIGTTTVVWTAIDEDENVSTASQIVNVMQRAPLANAGRDVTKTTVSKSLALTLNGSRSSDPDGHSLTYKWSAPKVRFSDPKSAKPTGTFPIGTTEVKLVVTDAAGARSTDLVSVTVKQKAKKKRSRSSLAVEHTAASMKDGEAAAASDDGGKVLAALDLSRRAYEQGARALAAEYAGDEARSGRLLQALSVSNLSAAERYLKVYAATGDESALAAGRHAHQAAAYGAN